MRASLPDGGPGRKTRVGPEFLQWITISIIDALLRWDWHAHVDSRKKKRPPEFRVVTLFDTRTTIFASDRCIAQHLAGLVPSLRCASHSEIEMELSMQG